MAPSLRLLAAAWLAAVVALLAACRPGEVPLPAHPLVASARMDDYPRPTKEAVPMREGEHGFDGCGIEAIQGATVSETMPDGNPRFDLPAVARGWAFPPGETPGIPDAWLRFLPVGEGAAAEFPIVLHYARPDVVAVHGNPRAAFSGFTDARLTEMAPGTYEAQVLFVSAAGRWACTPATTVHVQ